MFKKAKTRPPLPALSEIKTSPTSPKPDRDQDLEDFFDLLSIASSNRFDDQRSPAPKPLPQSKAQQSHSTPIHNNGGMPLDENPDTLTDSLDRGDLGLRLRNIPPPLVMSMPDLLSEDESDSQSGCNSIDRLYSTLDNPGTNSKAESQTDAHIPKKHYRPRAITLDQPLSEPLRRQVIQRAGNVVGEGLNTSPVGGSPVGGHRASPLATTTYVYNPGLWRQSIDGEPEGEGSHERQAESSLSPAEAEREDKRSREMSKMDCEEMKMDRDSPDGRYPTEVQVGDIGLPQRTFSDSATSRQHQRVRVSPSNPGQHSKRDCHSKSETEVREGWTDLEEGRRSSPRCHSSSGHRTPMTTPLDNSLHRTRRVLSEGDRCQSLDEIMEKEEARSTHILFGAGLGHLSPHSPIVKGVPMRGQSFSGGSPRLSNRKRPPIKEHHEM